MRLLVVGGSGWLGGAIARAALARGHATDVLARGQAPVPEGAGLVAADRTTALPDLAGAGYDAVLDSSAYLPGEVDRLADALGEGAWRYLVVSSISVYDGFDRPGLNEDAPARAATADEVASAEAEAAGRRTGTSVTGATYGPLKRSVELAALHRRGARATIVRPGLIVGPGDPTDRFTWWVRRLDRDGPVALPAPRTRPVQVIDVRDLADFALRLVERGVGGTFHAVGPGMSLERMVATLAGVAGRTVEPRWHPIAAFTALGLAPWSDLPLVVSDGSHMLELSAAAAQAAGLACRPLAETAADTLAWDRARRDRPLRAGMSDEAEAPLLQGPEPARPT